MPASHRRPRLRAATIAGLLGGLLLVSGCAGDPAAVTPAEGSQTSASSPTPTTRSPTTAVPPAVERPGSACLRPADRAQPVWFGPEQALGGYVIGSGTRYVVLAHQALGDSCQMLGLARRLAAAGFRALAYDSAGVGSSSAASSDGRQVADDVLAAVAWCRAHHDVSVGLVGASKGGYGVLDAGLRARPAVDAVVSLSAPSAWDDPRGRLLDISTMASPTQLWASRQDSGFVEAARRFAREDDAAELHVAPGAAHGVQLTPAVFPQVRDFLTAHLR